jgi:hypothetical protein
MKWVRAIVYNIILMVEVLLSPLLPKLYESYGAKPDSLIGVIMFISIMFLGQTFLLVMLYLSAIKNKNLKDF